MNRKLESDGQVVIEIQGDKKPIDKALRDTTSAIQNESKKWDTAVDDSAGNIQSKMVSAFKAIAGAAATAKIGKALLDFGVDAVNAASDLREVQNVVDVTFGEGAAQIETWAKKAQTQFGLTETRAKQFASTLGAMMKSSGIAGDEIIDMSTKLSGLAADMSSFYNLDFDTAFQKIRSGISGETEPLKQLGINMSVANLEAYALTQGITKSFEKMSQGEQTMLRYQYLMQATADAQGDFARTADGYANAQRRIQSAIESIKTSAGNMLMGVVEPLTTGFAALLEDLTATPEKTVLDEFADIDASTAAKMEEITQTANDARSLVEILNSIQAQNVSNASLTDFVGTLSTKIGGLDDAMVKAKNGDYAGTIKSIADAMALKSGVSPDKWNNLLTAVSEKLPGATSATDSDEEKTAKWLKAAGEAAAELGSEYPALWEQFMSVLGSEDTSKALEYMAGGQAAADAMKAIGIDAKGLDGTEKDKWSGLLGVLTTAEPTKGLFGADAATAAKNIGELSTALSSNDPATKKQAWSDMLGILTDNIDGVAELAKQSPEDTKKWLEGLATSADTIDPNDPKAWGELFDELLEGLPGLGNTSVGESFLSDLKTLAEDSNLLNASSATNWNKLLSTLNKADATKGLFGSAGKSAAENIKELSAALSGTDPSEKQAAWSTMLGTLSENAEGVSKLTGTDVEQTKKWLQGLAEAANTLDAGDTEGWSQLFTALSEGLPGLESGGAGAEFFAALSQGFMQLGQESSDAERALRGLGIDTSGVADKQALWLSVCKELVDTIPGLSSIINTETGEINGGVDAVNEYIDAWEQGQKKLAMLQAISAKREALRAANAEFYSLQNDLEIKKLQQQYYNRELTKLYDTVLKNGGRGTAEQQAERDRLQKDLANVGKEIETMQKRHDELEPVVTAAAEALDKEEEAVQAMYGDLGDFEKATEDATEATETFAESQKEVETAIKGATKALEEVDKYYEKTKDGIRKTIESVGGAFGAIETPAQKAQREVKEIQQALKDAKTDSEKNALQVKLQGAGEAIQTINKITNGLKSQISYYQEYSTMLAKAREMGYSDDVLAQVADGTAESFDRLAALTGAGVSKKQVEEVNTLFAKTAEEVSKLTDELTDQSLKVDEEFQSLVKSATDAVNELNLGDSAKTAMENTVQGIADGIATKIPAVQTQVDALNKVLSQLNNTGKFGFSFGTGLRFGGSGGLVAKPEGEFETGLDRVPFNDFLAILHEGESVLTAEEAKVWRNFKYGGMSSRNSIDYDALGATMRDNVHAGGNVYLNGRTVGRVISDMQADSYRSMERSGFQQ